MSARSLPVVNSDLLIDRQEFKRRSQTVIVGLHRTPHDGDCIADVQVGQRTVAALRTILPELMRIGNYDESPELYERFTKGLVELVAPALAAALHYVEAAAPHAIVVRGILLSSEPVVTPSNGIVDQTACATEIAVLTGVAGILGLAGFAYKFENGGRMLRAVCAVKELVRTRSSQGADDLGWHEDNVSQAIPRSNDPHPQPFPPANRIQGFTAITPLEEVPMRIVSLEDVLALMRGRGWEAHITTLTRSEFCVKTPDSHDNAHEIGGLPILVSGDDGKYAARYHAGNVRGETPEAILALHTFSAALAQCTEMTWVGTRGDLLFYRNSNTLHRRTEFTPAFDGNDRYYIRAYYDDAHAIAALASANGGRVFGT